jgi:diguanylate cyclase (GGDEF)-like protein
MTTPLEEMASIADRIRVECGIVRFFWFQFEALAPGSEFKSWWWGPGAEALEEGVPEPDRYPPALPGVHRRTPWQILERQLRSRPDGTVLGRIRLWCDPRLLDPRQVELLDRLLPQMTAAVQRCLLDREAREDPLTGVAMRRVLERRLNEVHARCCEAGGAMAVLLCDLDHFKRINDTWGHPAGDAALIAVAGVLKSLRRTEDLCCRYGGEEFVLLMEGTSGEGGLAVAERLRRSVEALEFKVEGRRVPLTLSAGVASFPDLYIKTAAELILFADEALYEAKRRGRNRCLLDIGQGRYMDVEGGVLATEEAAPAAAAPRIFA